MSIGFPNPGWSTSGWTCRNCGGWVRNGNTHSCRTIVAPPVEYQPDAFSRIAAALERIAAALEASA